MSLDDRIPLNQSRGAAPGSDRVQLPGRIRLHGQAGQADGSRRSQPDNGRSGRSAMADPQISDSERDMEVLLGQDLRRGKPGVSRDALLTFYTEDGQAFSVSREQLSMHFLLIGGIGSGKTNVFYQFIGPIRRKMTLRDIMIIFDTKGDYETEFPKRPQDILIGNGPEYQSRSAIWNIYGEVMGELLDPSKPYVYKKEWESNAREIIKTMFKSRRSSTQPFFADAAADLIALKMIQVMRHGDFSEMHTYKLKEFFANATVEAYDSYVLGEPGFAYAKQYYGDGTTPQALAVFAYINSMISDCLIGIFGDRSSGPEFAMRELVKNKGNRVVYVEYDLRMGEILGPIYQLLYDQALKEALGRSENERGDIYLMCDEMKMLGELNHIDDGLNFGRGLGVKIISGLQSVEQLYDIYGDHRAKAIMAGFSNMICFRTADHNTREYVSEYFGRNYTQIPIWHDGKLKEYYQRESHIVEHWHIQRLRRGQAVVGLWQDPPAEPFLVRFKKYQGE